VQNTQETDESVGGRVAGGRGTRNFQSDGKKGGRNPRLGSELQVRGGGKPGVLQKGRG